MLRRTGAVQHVVSDVAYLQEVFLPQCVKEVVNYVLVDEFIVAYCN